MLAVAFCQQVLVLPWLMRYSHSTHEIVQLTLGGWLSRAIANAIKCQAHPGSAVAGHAKLPPRSQTSQVDSDIRSWHVTVSWSKELKQPKPWQAATIESRPITTAASYSPCHQCHPRSSSHWACPACWIPACWGALLRACTLCCGVSCCSICCCFWAAWQNCGPKKTQTVLVDSGTALGDVSRAHVPRPSPAFPGWPLRRTCFCTRNQRQLECGCVPRTRGGGLGVCSWGHLMLWMKIYILMAHGHGTILNIVTSSI